MTLDLREPFILKAMGLACTQVISSKGFIGDGERHDIAERIVERASTGETDIDKLVEFAVADQMRSN